MGLAGAGNQETCRKLIQLFLRNHSSIARDCFVTTDAVASIATASRDGRPLHFALNWINIVFLEGVVLIAGTGSACRYMDKIGEVFGTGGHGHLIEDSGSGFWIAQQSALMD